MRGSAFVLVLPMALMLVACGESGPRVVTADGTVLSYSKKQRGTGVLSGGAGYHGAVLQETAAAPEAASKPAPAKAAPGKLPLPTQYPLLPGDAELWPTLTLEQQQRALLFLQDGSTIRASLRTD